MKRGLSMLLTILLTFCMTSCFQREKTPLEVLYALLDRLDTQSVCCTVYERSDFMKNEEQKIFLASLYGEKELPGQLGAAGDYAVALSKKDLGFEIQVFRLAHLSESRRIAELLEIRMDFLRTVDNKRYLLEEYDNYIASMMIYSYGNYIFLLATGDNDRAIEAVKEIL